MEKRGILRQAFHRFYQRHWRRFHPVRNREWDMFVRWLRVTPGMRVLDVGCGNGFFVRRSHTPGSIVIGIDLSWDGIIEANHYNRDENCGFAIANAMTLPFPDASFDAVMSVSSLEHFADDRQAVREINRVLKPSGPFVLTVDSLSYRGISAAYREACCKKHLVVRCYTAQTLENLLVSAGFHVLDHRYLFASVASSAVYKLSTFLRWRGIELLDPIIYPVVRPLSLWSDTFLGHKNEGYILAALAEKAVR